MTDIKYKRVLMKLSGEALAGDKGQGIDLETVSAQFLGVKKNQFIDRKSTRLNSSH